MTRELAIRTLGLYVPMAIAGALWWWRRPDTRVAAATLLACVWIAPALLVLQTIAQTAGWWTFRASGGTLAGIPVDLYLGWILLWGVGAVLAFRSVPLPIAVLVALWIDLLVMPLCTPVLTLGPSWLIGETVAIGLVLVPALTLARWTIADRHVAGRAILQAAAFSGLVFFVAPAIALEQAGGSWRPLLDRPLWATNLLVQVLALPGVLGLSAVQEFASRGRGTPLPFDPPLRLVSTGPYAYVANPMQLATCIALVIWAALIENWWVLGGSLTTFAYGAGIAGWHEELQLQERFGPDWTTYRRAVRPWRIRWRPFILPASRARLYVAETCGLCADAGRWLARRHAIGIDILGAETHAPRELRRMTYVGGDGHEEEGVAAFARALEHVNVAWAWIGMLMRLPIVRPMLQLLVDASGGQARRVSPSCVSKA
jgi:protein-S-isoprenylcysteine O-methyltransferase Ste14